MEYEPKLGQQLFFKRCVLTVAFGREAFLIGGHLEQFDLRRHTELVYYFEIGHC